MLNRAILENGLRLAIILCCGKTKCSKTAVGKNIFSHGRKNTSRQSKNGSVPIGWNNAAGKV